MSQDLIPQITHTELIGDLMGALSKAQSRISRAVKSKTNPFFKSNYADLPAIWEACKEPLSANGLAIVQTVEGTAEQMYLTTILGHASNQWIKSKIPLILAKRDPQSMGSCITYARRYALAAMVGVCQEDEDDDGEAATSVTRKEDYKEKQKKEEKDMSLEEVNVFLEMNWNDEQENFSMFMNSVMKQKNWNYRKCIDSFSKDADYTAKAFSKWKETLVKLI